MNTSSSRSSARADAAPRRRTPRPKRNRAWVPDQHGAWVMVILPFLIGVFLAGVHPLHIPLAIAWLSGYFCFFAAGLFLKVRTATRGDRRAQYATPMYVYGAISALASLIVLVFQPQLIAFALLFGPLVAIAVWEAWNKRGRSLASGLSTVVASSLLVAVACAITDQLDRGVWITTLLLALYFAGTVPLVKTLIRDRGSRRMLAISLGMHVAAAVVAVGLFFAGEASWFTAIVFCLLVVRAAVLPTINNRRIAEGEAPLSAKKVGRWESLWTLLVTVAILLPV
ncbi:YwiC-like family protein [Corynebacterium sp. 11A]|uniref:YwiC-like family protein n=1 Tax=unclassified Corynebacterium TaxID=2624378 RepID=UPI00124ED2CC|nr:YwiC-like family protein [Corynebacterium sp. 11A]MBV7281900.1 YwiC-like family protein [Corynebacterium sp. TAE3-ERU30]